MTKTINEKVQFSTLVRANPERVYAALTTAQGLDAWFTTNAEVDARPGGKIIFRWRDYAENGGPVLEAIPPKRFVFQWKADTDAYLTTVAIDFEPTADGTRVSLSEYGYEDTPTGLKDMLARATGWAEELTLMKFHLEHGLKVKDA
jgi:uncharacterized protein YndB with AHSA1/START domain